MGGGWTHNPDFNKSLAWSLRNLKEFRKSWEKSTAFQRSHLNLKEIWSVPDCTETYRNAYKWKEFIGLLLSQKDFACFPGSGWNIYSYIFHVNFCNIFAQSIEKTWSHTWISRLCKALLRGGAIEPQKRLLIKVRKIYAVYALLSKSILMRGIHWAMLTS